ncbi:MAG: bifunctional phosphoglucose/phosphomannose isomerase [Actinomycetota bacterium]
MISLDDPGALAAADPHDALGAVERYPEQWLEALTRAHSCTGLPTRHGITSLVYCGMGGSGIAGDVLAAIAAESGSVPVGVVKGRRLPAWAGPNTLVVCASYSGDTEETLACFEDAIARKARTVVISTGGKLAARAAQVGAARISPVEGLQPRQALPSLAAPALVVAEQLGLLAGMSDAIQETTGILSSRVANYGRDVPTDRNDGKQLAAQLDGTVPLIWGQEGVLSVAAQRWRTQLNENAKTPAFSNFFSELDHNEIVGFEAGAPGLRDLGVVVLRAPGESFATERRIEATLDRVRSLVATVCEARAVGESPLARLMSSVILGDFVSVYLAVRRGVDPTPVAAIDELKSRLA